MAGQSGHNLSITKSKMGCRFPFESPNAGDGYASSGPCLVRKMTPEERARYGPPPKPRAEENPFHSRFRQAIKVSKSPEQAAELLGMTVGQLNQHLGANGLHPRWDKRKEDETVEDIQVYDNQEISDSIVQSGPESQENKVFEVYDKKENPDTAGQEPPKPKTRMELAREKLSSEEYMRLKGEGKADGEIRVLFKIAGDVLVRLKKEWGLVIRPGIATHKQDLVQSPPENTPQQDPVPQPEPETQLNESRPSGLTIAQAIELRDELIEDVDDYNHVLRECEEWVSGRILMALRLQLDIHQQALDRINEVFERTVVEL